MPTQRHRDAWAEPAQAPTSEEWAREREEVATKPMRRGESTSEEGVSRSAQILGDTPRSSVVLSDENVPLDPLVVVSKLKSYIRARSSMNTSDGVVDALSAHLRKLCDAAIQQAAQAGRKTVMDRDFEALAELNSTRRRGVQAG